MAQVTSDDRSQVATLAPGLAAHRPRVGSLATRLGWLVAALAMAASLLGLLIDGIYAGATSTAEMLRGYDLVTVAVVVPGLMVALRFARRGSVRGQLFAASLLAYLVYTYAYYLFGTGFNDLFLFRVAVLGLRGERSPC